MTDTHPVVDSTPSPALAVLWRLAGPVRGQLATAMVLQALSSISGVVGLVAAIVVVQHALRAGSQTTALTDSLPVAALAVVALGLVGRAVLLAAATTVSHAADTRLQRHLRGRVADYLESLPIEEFQGRDSASVKRMLTDDVGALHNVMAHAAIDAVSSVVTPIAAVAALCWLSPQAGLVGIIPALVGALIQLRHARSSGNKMAEYSAHVQALDSAAVTAVEGVAIAKVFLAADDEGHGADEFRTVAQNYARFVRRWAVSVGRSMAVAEVCLGAILACSAAVGAGVLFGASVVQIVAATLLAPAVGAAVLPLAYAVQSIDAGVAAAQRLDAVFSPQLSPASSASCSSAVGFPDDWQRIEFSDVTICRGGREIVSGVNATLVRGRSIALVGGSGAGKTTLACALAGLYRLDRGEIRIVSPRGTVSIAELTMPQLGEHIAFVGQHPGVLHASVADNVAMSQDADLQRVAQCVRDAALSPAVLHPGGDGSAEGTDDSAWLSARVGDELELSGGEKQRLTLARALYRDMSLLVLDEPTAAIDVLIESTIDATLRQRHHAGVTVLRVDHRLHFARTASEVWVMDQGRLVEVGSPAELLARPDSAFSALAAHSGEDS
ncbi:ABC transporter ATP-binding protein [Corynebacterium sp. 13CS0277]|uniref:ABC transporter ATP-binding protein n=1 Tax=Corynebacterium sp. 13CS0277 TaxID=2071994 RepID=UPI0013048E2C|nr:ABC transporter ATP-binding protein [Corynebacterium sp. 13CS0277]